MFQNLKVDILYYKTNTDFEMEFNLCGCCRMRLLTDKSPDRKTALHSLARAVSRSRIIIITGGLFGDDGIINIVSSATGIPVAELDKSGYGISGEEKIEILKGATPLVTAEGYFGGLIIESGPQTMILISENKNIRKNIMQNLIHPYIEELCAVELKEKAAAVSETHNLHQNAQATVDFIEDINETSESQEESNQEITEEVTAEEAVDETENEQIEDSDSDVESESGAQEAAENQEIYTETEEEIVIDTTQSDAEENAIISSGMIFESDDDFVVTPLEDVEAPLVIDTNQEDNATETEIKITEEYIKDFVIETEDYYNKKSKFSFSLNKVILALAIFLLIVFAVLCFCIFYVPSAEGVGVGEYIRETFNTLFGKA